MNSTSDDNELERGAMMALDLVKRSSQRIFPL
jgi:hypothetical protein